MRLVVDNWILTTIRHKNEDQQVKANSLTVDQRVEQEQNLFDTSHDLDSSHSSSKSLNQIEADEDKMQSDAADIIKDFASYLYNVLDVSSFGQVEAHLDQLAKMVRHLNDEHRVLRNELDEQFFDDQNQIVKFVQDTLCMKNLLMCQSVSVLERANVNILESVECHLDHHSCAKVNRMLQQIQRANGSLIDTVKTLLKQNINQMKNYVHIWNEFEHLCEHLDTIFSQHTTPFVCSIQFRSISIEINNSINRLKEKLNTLTSILSEAKYFELKNLIVIYEIKFKRLKESNETENATPEAMVPSSARQIVRLNQKQTESPINWSGKLSNYQIRHKTTVTCDKSTFTVNNESTQTESIVYESVMQSDGKKMLLEAYLRNNGNLASCSTSSKKNKSESGTGMMRESGIGTANDDDSLPLTDAEKHCDDEDKLNISVETYPVDTHKKYVRKKTNKLKSMSTLSSSSTCSSSKTQSNVVYQRKNKKAKQVSPHELNQQMSSQSLLRFLMQKLIKFIFIFLLPILFILLFLAYVLYRNYLNPNCCDMKRNYLLINVT